MLHIQQSPWLFELKNKREPYKGEQLSSRQDIIIIGAGIAGIMTAYYALLLTDKKVLLLEANTIASGATGHNAGQIVTYFERPTEEIIEQFGLELTIEAQQDINSGWDLLEEIRKTVSLKTPLHIFEGLAGCASFKSVNEHLENRYYRPQLSHHNEFCLVADDYRFLHQIPEMFKDLYTIVPRKVILDLLETKDTSYAVAFTSRKGCMNSAMFSEEIVKYLLKHYPDRFQIAENTRVSEVILNKDTAECILNKKTKLPANRVILCTNGFKDLKIINKAGETISAEYHELIRGKKGFMKAYTFKDDGKPTAISYYNTSDKPYFYLTRRPSTFSKTDEYNLVAVGGPEYFLPDKSVYHQDSEYPEEILKKIDFFIKWTRLNEFRDHYEHLFIWHGLMGYTRNGIRLIGPDKHNPLLMYNLGCNGVGILPSIFGAQKIAKFLLNQITKKSLFDPYI